MELLTFVVGVLVGLLFGSLGVCWLYKQAKSGKHSTEQQLLSQSDRISSLEETLQFEQQERKKEQDARQEETDKLKAEKSKLKDEKYKLSQLMDESSQVQDANSELKEQVHKLKTLIREQREATVKNKASEFVEREVAALLRRQTVVHDPIETKEQTVDTGGHAMRAHFIAFLLVAISVFSTAIFGGVLIQWLFRLLSGLDDVDIGEWDKKLLSMKFWRVVLGYAVLMFLLPFAIVVCSLILHNTCILTRSAFQNQALGKCRSLFLVWVKRTLASHVQYFRVNDVRRWCRLVDSYFTDYLDIFMFAGAFLGRPRLDLMSKLTLPLSIFLIFLSENYTFLIEKYCAFACVRKTKKEETLSDEDGTLNHGEEKKKRNSRFIGALLAVVAKHVLDGIRKGHGGTWLLSPGGKAASMAEAIWAGALSGAMWWTVVTVVLYLAADMLVRWRFEEENIVAKLRKTIKSHNIKLGAMSNEDSLESLTTCWRIHSQTDEVFPVTLRRCTPQTHGLTLSDKLEILGIDGEAKKWNKTAESDTMITEGSHIVEVNQATTAEQMKALLNESHEQKPKDLRIMVQKRHEEQRYWLIIFTSESDVKVSGPDSWQATLAEFRRSTKWLSTHMIMDQSGESLRFFGQFGAELRMKEEWWRKQVRDMVRQCCASAMDDQESWSFDIRFDNKIAGMQVERAAEGTFDANFQLLTFDCSNQIMFIKKGTQPKRASFFWAPANISKGMDGKERFRSIPEREQFELHGGITSLNISFEWKDQGWGDSGGAVELQICRESDVVVVQKLLFVENPSHNWTRVHKTLELGQFSAEMSSVRPEDRICLRYKVGKESYQMLHLKDIRVWGEYRVDKNFAECMSSANWDCNSSTSAEFAASPQHEHSVLVTLKRGIRPGLYLSGWALISVSLSAWELALDHQTQAAVVVLSFFVFGMLYIVHAEVLQWVPSLKQDKYYYMFLTFFSIMLGTALMLSLGVKLTGEDLVDVQKFFHELNPNVNHTDAQAQTLAGGAQKIDITTNFDAGYTSCRIRWGGKENPVSIVDLAALSNDAYHAEDKAKVIKFDNKTIWDESNAKFTQKSLPSLTVTRFQKPDTVGPTVVVAIKGTSTFQDTFADVSFYGMIACLQILSLGIDFIHLSPRGLIADMIDFFNSALKPEVNMLYETVARTVKGIEKAHPGASVVLTGHSLGGGIAGVMGAKLELPTVVFSAPGGHYSRRFMGPNSAEQQYRNVLNVVPDDDVVTKVDRQDGTVQKIVCLTRFSKEENGITKPMPIKGCHDFWQTYCELLRACGAPKDREEIHSTGWRYCKWIDSDFKAYIDEKDVRTVYADGDEIGSNQTTDTLDPRNPSR